MSKSSNIPKARRLLEEVVRKLTRKVLKDHIRKDIMPLLRRAPACRRAPGKRHRFSEREKLRIKLYASAHPEKTMSQIAWDMKVRNEGRISQILNGKRI